VLCERAKDTSKKNAVYLNKENAVRSVKEPKIQVKKNAVDLSEDSLWSL